MGQGFSLATPSAGSASIDIPELSDLTYEKSLGNARFMKSIRARHADGVVLVKALVKPYTPMSLEKYKREIRNQSEVLARIPNALGFGRVIETDTNGFLVRQFLYSSLYDRISTRPFLEDIEKKWLAFQLLCGLRDCHANDIYHGDIKAQNVLVTSWNWLYLTDFSSTFKPIMLPDDNPADFSYYFDTVGERTCYLAPERFLPAGATIPTDAKLTWSMDIFSAGCVIAQLFLENELFTLSQLFRYRRGEYDPSVTSLSVIADKGVREMIAHMIQLDPEKRYSADQYLQFWRGKAFPEYFYSFLHQYMEMVTDPSSGNSPISGASRNLGEPDERIDRVFYDFDKIAYFLGYQDAKRGPPPSPAPRSKLGLAQFPVRFNIPNYEHYVSSSLDPPADDGTLIFLSLVVSSIRNTARSASKLRACEILLAFSERLTDEAKLDRVLPYFVCLLTDKSDMVVVAAIRSITQLLQLVRVVTPINSHVFVEYILPRAQAAIISPSSSRPPPSALVRATYASCIGSLATTATRFLEMAASLRGSGSLTVSDPEVESAGVDIEPVFDYPFDNAQHQLIDLFEVHTKALAEDPDVNVRRAFLTSVPELCMFFGPLDSNDILLSHLNTYLNDRDWMLKCAFFDTIVGIATLLGTASFEAFILPLMVQALTDSEEYVVQAALHSLAQLAELGLLSRAKLWEFVDIAARFTVHPNIWIREAATEFISAASRFASPADIRCIVLPLVKPYIKPGIIPEFDELALLDALRKPLPRPVFDHSVQWALQTQTSLFWMPLRQMRSSTLSGSRQSRDFTTQYMSRMPKNEEDEKWLSKLRHLGLGPEDEPKLLALREFIWRLGVLRSREGPSTPNDLGTPNEIISLKTLGLTPQTVFFDEEPLHQSTTGVEDDAKAPYTIADALLDASMTIDESISRRKRAALNRHRTRAAAGTSSPRQLVSRSVSPYRRVSIDSTAKPPTRGALLAPPSEVDDDSASIRSQPYASRRAIRHQSSALSLLDRKDSNKTVAETGMTEANAFGEVERLFSPTPATGLRAGPSDASSVAGASPVSKIRANHTYEGNDPNILRMLDAMYVDNYPHDIAEFGPMVTPVGSKQPGRVGLTQTAPDVWKPQGRLVATFSEHTGPVNRVVVSPDHVFFITGGDDGAVKVWDTMRLEANVSHRSRQTHRHATGARVIALCFIEKTHCFISCATDGSVHVVKVDAFPSTTGTRYGKLRLLREYHLPAGEFAVWCEHFKIESSSVLVLATNRSRIIGIDLRNMSLLYILENPVHHGTPTCFCIDRKRNWLCLGTSHGVLDLWDLRFKMRLKGWGVPGKSAIYRVAIHPTRGRGRWVCVAGGTGQGEVTVWDLEKTLCREIYRVGGNKDGPKGYEAWEVDEDKAEGMLGRFATNIEPTTAAANSDRGVRAMICGSGPGDDQIRDVRHAFIVTGGSDKKLRFWDLSRVENSSVYSGLNPDESRPTFTASHPTSTMTLNTEKVQRPSAPTRNGKSTSRTTPRSTVISVQQQQLLRSHLDSIMDVTVLEVPYGMSVSVDRLGVIFVFK